MSRVPASASEQQFRLTRFCASLHSFMSGLAGLATRAVLRCEPSPNLTVTTLAVILPYFCLAPMGPPICSAKVGCCDAQERCFDVRFCQVPDLGRGVVARLYVCYLLHMDDVVALIDGFNMYHALSKKRGNHAPYQRYKWINYWALAECFKGANATVKDVYLFSAYLPGGEQWHQSKNARHAKLIAANKLQGVKIVLGRFFERESTYLARPTRLRISFPTLEEKRTDVNIAITLIELAVDKAYDRCLLFTADSDLVPAIEHAKLRHPAGDIISVPPIERGGISKALRGACGGLYKKMKESHLQQSQLPLSVTHPTATGTIIACPQEWT